MMPKLSLGCVLASTLFLLSPSVVGKKLITPEVDGYIKTVIREWNLTGLAIGLVRQDPESPAEWYTEFESYGIARADGTTVTPDTLFDVASNCKLFTAFATGLLISNETLAKERGAPLSWFTKVKDVFGDMWELWDEDATRRINFQDMLSHRTGVPRHDGSDIRREGGLVDKIKTLRYLRPSAEFRETYQYNNLMYDSLGYLPELFFNQTLESYVEEHIFGPLEMSSATYSVAKAEEGPFAHGFQVSGQDTRLGISGIKKEVVPYFVRPGDEGIYSGSGGLILSARDAVTWLSALLSRGRHPHGEGQVVPAGVVDYTATGVSVEAGTSLAPEMSAAVYGAGQSIYSYRGHQILEHGGSAVGFTSTFTRLPSDNLGIALLSNDWASNTALEAIKWRLVDEIVVEKAASESRAIDWISRYKLAEEAGRGPTFTPRPRNTILPVTAFSELNGRLYDHPTYGLLRTCYAFDRHGPVTKPDFEKLEVATSNCSAILNSLSVRHILELTDPTIPTFIIPFNATFVTHIRLCHHSGNLFNLTAFYANADIRLKEGISSIVDGVWTDDGDVVLPLQDAYVEWVTQGPDEGVAFKGDIWMMGSGGREPEGNGKDGAEVWFTRIGL